MRQKSYVKTIISFRRPSNGRVPGIEKGRSFRSDPRKSSKEEALFDEFDLLELELDRSRSAEDRHADLDSAAVEIEFLDDPVEAREGAVEHLHIVADLIVDADLLLRRSGGRFVLGVEDPRR